MTFLVVLAAWASLLGSCTASHVIHEERSVPVRARQSTRVDADAIIPFRIGLRQSNLHTGDDRLMAVSHPSSPSFGQHLSAEEVHGLFAPLEESERAVVEWLLESGVDGEDLLLYENRGWIGLDITAKQAEELFSAEYHEYDLGSKVRIGCDRYHLPEDISAHVDFVKPGVMLSSPLKKRTIDRRQTSYGYGHGHGHGHGYGHGPPHRRPKHYPHYHPPPHAGPLPQDLKTCSANMTPTCIQALYTLPRLHQSDSVNAMGLYETYDAFSNQDIQLFSKNHAPWVPQGTTPKVISVDGGTAPVAPGDVRNGGESDIDIDLAQSLIYPQKVVVYQVDDLPTASGARNTDGFLNTFFDSVDGSYCNYKVFGIKGDSPGVDPTYPDSLPGGYKGQRQCGTYQLTKVVSISYAEPEIDLPKRYVERSCKEIMKLGMQGHSILVASGDYGVASFPGSDNDTFGCLSGGGQSGTVYNPEYPAVCPYITSVGATRLYINQTVRDAESAMQVDLSVGQDPPQPALAFFASGGGFSNYFKRPSYQDAVVSQYLAQHSPNVPSYVADANASNIGQGGGVYNRAGRGFPDVSANGAYLLAPTNLTTYHYFGTSLASPIFGAVLTLLNEDRAAAGKGSVGFVNPVLYKNPSALNDITNGSNPNCGSSGFSTSRGWDPVTGLGTPNYPKMRELYLSLP